MLPPSGYRHVFQKSLAHLLKDTINYRFHQSNQQSLMRPKTRLYEHSPPYSPQSIGMVERVNSTIVNQIRAIINDPTINISWTQAAYKVVDIYNETVHSATKFKPNEIAIENPSIELLETINENNRKSRLYTEQRANRYREQIEYSPGDQVLIVNERQDTWLRTTANNLSIPSGT
ncbi:hypothetical protein DERP_015342 [Dermatophagoides pteronyssinus]|uniref:Integrase catalytic domain-containing protein n=1 Tax=Dermatophagoides pteronyssinus TaxID=6956 RepID=A0ABQ8JWL8_DERPT|nr:hypothetical protein DERP_015320 [Dermatophagoides pteronyssinus]KAH9427014.1 hypothetical protein DERP_015342 [Dermatophagoides pteronyssinus]